GPQRPSVKSLRHLSVMLARSLGRADLSTRQGQCFERPLKSKLGFVIRLLGFTLARCVQCALVFCRRPVPLSHRSPTALDGLRLPCERSTSPKIAQCTTDRKPNAKPLLTARTPRSQARLAFRLNRKRVCRVTLRAVRCGKKLGG